MTVSFTVPGVPVPKGRPRVTRYATFTPQSTVDYENRIRDAWQAAGAAAFPAACPLTVEVRAYFPMPKGTSRRRRLLLEDSPHIKHRGDIDNVVKAVLDALNGRAFPDDCAVCRIVASKAMSETPRTEVHIQNFEEVSL